MQIFAYRCTSCGKAYEELVFGDRDRIIPCPVCGSEGTEKIPSVIGGSARSSSSFDTPCGSSCARTPACTSGDCCPHTH